MKKFKMNNLFSSGEETAVSGIKNVLLGDAERMGEFSEVMYQIAGLLLANYSGGLFKFAISKIPWIQNKPDYANLAIALLGGVASWRLPDILKAAGLHDLASKFDDKNSFYGNARNGAMLLYALSLVHNSFGVVGKNIGYDKFPMGLLSGKEGIVTSTTSGVGFLPVFGTSEFQKKADDLAIETSDLQSKLGQLPASSSPQGRTAMYHAQKLLDYAKVTNSNVQNFIRDGKFEEARESLGDIIEFNAVVTGLITGLAAGNGSAPELPGQGLDTITIQNENGQAATVTPPPVEMKDVVDQEGKKVEGLAFSIDQILPWSQYVSQQMPGWTPTQAAVAFILKYLSYQGHTWAYGPQQVMASSNWGVSGSQIPAYMVHTSNNGDQNVYQVGSVEDVYGIVSNILNW